MKSRDKVRVGGVVFLLDYVRERGGRPERVLRAAGVVPIELESETAWIDFDRMAALYEAAAVELDDEFFAWRFAQEVPLSSFGLLAYAVLNAPDVRTGLENMIRYGSELSISLQRTVLRVDGGVAQLGFCVAPDGVEKSRQLLEGHLAIVLRTLKQLVGDEWAARGFSLQRVRRKADPALEELLGAKVRFGDELNSVSFDASFLEFPVVGADRSFLPMIERWLAELSSAERGEFAARVGVEVARILCDGSPPIVKVARQMAMSPRTLQRRLTQDGLTFRELVGDVRMEVAEGYLEDPKLGVGEIATLLGYRERSSFTHAFRSSHGISPQQWRKARSSSRGPGRNRGH